MLVDDFDLFKVDQEVIYDSGLTQEQEQPTVKQCI